MNEYFKKVRANKPLVHCLTNYITANDCANILLALGASPIMAHHPAEVCEVTAKASALLCNFGATEYYEAMEKSCAIATKNNIPIIIDPVGVSGIEFRRDFFWKLANVSKISCVRGNASEIKALYTNSFTGAGVDAADKQQGEIQVDIEEACKGLSKSLNCIIIASGVEDILAAGDTVFHIKGGSARMKSITGAGCMSSAVIAAFLGCEGNGDIDSAEIVMKACELMNKCAEIAGSYCDKEGLGSQSFRLKLIDTVSVIS